MFPESFVNLLIEKNKKYIFIQNLEKRIIEILENFLNNMPQILNEYGIHIPAELKIHNLLKETLKKYLYLHWEISEKETKLVIKDINQNQLGEIKFDLNELIETQPENQKLFTIFIVPITEILLKNFPYLYNLHKEQALNKA